MGYRPATTPRPPRQGVAGPTVSYTAPTVQTVWDSPPQGRRHTVELMRPRGPAPCQVFCVPGTGLPAAGAACPSQTPTHDVCVSLAVRPQDAHPAPGKAGGGRSDQVEPTASVSGARWPQRSPGAALLAVSLSQAPPPHPQLSARSPPSLAASRPPLVRTLCSYLFPRSLTAPFLCRGGGRIGAGVTGWNAERVTNSCGVGDQADMRPPSLASDPWPWALAPGTGLPGNIIGSQREGHSYFPCASGRRAGPRPPRGDPSVRGRGDGPDLPLGGDPGPPSAPATLWTHSSERGPRLRGLRPGLSSEGWTPASAPWGASPVSSPAVG